MGVRELSRKLGTSHGWVTRTEAGTRSISVDDVAAVLVALGISSTERERIVAMAQDVDEPNWLRPGIPGAREELVTSIEYERTATHMVEVAPLLVPGLLQIADYTRAVMDDLPATEAETKIAMRASRRDVLTRRQAPGFEALISEQVLTDPLCDKEVQEDQLRHLIKMAGLPNVSIRVVPGGQRRWTPAHQGQCTMFEFGTASPIVHLENLASGVFLSSTSVVEKYSAEIDKLRAMAMRPAAASRFIAECIEAI